MELFGNILTESSSVATSYDTIIRALKMPIVKPRHRVSVLNVDESVDYIIPTNDILNNGISYTENYQQGQRKNITLKLANANGKYNLAVDNIWIDKKFKYEMGLELLDGSILWFPKGIYIMGNVESVVENSLKEITIQLKDKFALFEGKTGTLENAYEVPTDSTIEDVVSGLLNFDMGNGYILDYKSAILDSSYKNFKTQATIRKEEGDNLGAVVLELATQLSAECYYNNVGNLCFYPIDDTVNDGNKPVIWTYENLGRDLHSLSLSYNSDEIVNVVKVVGDNVENGVYSAVAENNNSASPVCIERIGRRSSSKYSEANVWSDDIAESLANYYLRKNSFLAVQFSTSVSYNPILSVNNICEVENNFLNLKREKLLISSISYTSDTSIMTITCANTSDLPFT